MFNIFKRPAARPAKAAQPARRRNSSPRSHPTELSERPPLPEVVEGNEHTDWALWEDSVTVLDSQMQGLTPAARIYEKDQQTPSEFQDLDPYARVNKKSR